MKSLRITFVEREVLNMMVGRGDQQRRALIEKKLKRAIRMRLEQRIQER